jgi:phosphopantothenoylcysteine decarboxylase/phosphopantothenate--cysteine ligase
MIPVETGVQMRTEVLRAAEQSDIVVMAAAVADYTPVQTASHKMKKSGSDSLHLELRQTPDILAELVAQRRHGQVIVGFAAETGDSDADVLAHGRAKLARKGCDVLVVNDVSGDLAFGSLDNEVTVLTAAGEVHVPRSSKDEIADAVWSLLVPLHKKGSARN